MSQSEHQVQAPMGRCIDVQPRLRLYYRRYSCTGDAQPPGPWRRTIPNAPHTTADWVATAYIATPHARHTDPLSPPAHHTPTAHHIRVAGMIVDRAPDGLRMQHASGCGRRIHDLACTKGVCGCIAAGPSSLRVSRRESVWRARLGIQVCATTALTSL